jgi:type II secretory pathway pseudopilin PulG
MTLAIAVVALVAIILMAYSMGYSDGQKAERERQRNIWRR